MTKIYSPNPEANGPWDYAAGTKSLTFVDGVADYDGQLPEALAAYFASAGYRVEGEVVDLADSAAGPLADDLASIQGGAGAAASASYGHTTAEEATP